MINFYDYKHTLKSKINFYWPCRYVYGCSYSANTMTKNFETINIFLMKSSNINI